MVDIRNTKRIFKYKGEYFNDIDPSFSAQEVLNHYANIKPELTNAIIKGPEVKDDGSVQYEFSTQLGTKG